MIYTLFVSPFNAAWRGDVDDPSDGQFVGQYLNDFSENILYTQIKSIEVDTGVTSSITFAPASALKSEWLFLIAKVVGTARLNVTALDTDGTTPISSKVYAYGVERYPGFSMLSSYNITAISVEGRTDGTMVELFAAIACADNDARMVTNL